MANCKPLLTRLSTDILRESPEYATALAVSEEQAGGSFNDRLSDPTREGTRRYKGILATGLNDLRALNRDSLSAQDRVTVDVVSTSFENDIADINYEPSASYPYVVSQLTGSYTQGPDFLDSQHPIKTRANVDGYLARLSAFARTMDEESRQVASDSGRGFHAAGFRYRPCARTIAGLCCDAPG